MSAAVTPSEVERCLDDALAVCAIPAPTGSEAARGEWVAEQLTASGLEPEVDAVGNVTARVGGPGPAVTLAAHLDTVFDDAGPIEVTRDGAMLCGPGIGDNSLGVAGLLFAARRAAIRPLAGHRPLLLAATVGEEGLGDLRGATALLEQTECAEFVALEGSGRHRDPRDRSCRFEVVASAPGGHSWRDRANPSAIHELIALLDELIRRAPAAATNVGTIAGGTGVNIMASEARALVEFRDLSGDRVNAAAVFLRRQARLRKAEVSVIGVGTRPAGQTARSHPLVSDVVAAREAAGLPKASLTEASTDANAALGRRIPAITVGLGRSYGAHTRSERVDTAGLDRAMTALAKLLDARTAATGGPG